MGKSSRAQQRAAQIEKADLTVANAEAELDKGLGAWRNFPAMPSDRQWAEARAERAWPGSQPTRPIECLFRENFARECDERAVREVPRESARWILGAILAVFALVAVAAFSSGCGMALFGILAVLVLAPELGKPSRRAALRAQYFSSGWPTYWQVVQDEWDRFQKWPARERARAALADRVARGDLKAIHEAIVEALQVQALPYELKYFVRVDDEQEAFVLIDLPEIEDEIPEEKLKALKSGALREVRRTKRERQENYAGLVAGIALHSVRVAFFASPTLERVTVAGYSQRRRSGSGELNDDFLYEATFDRSSAGSWSSSTADPVEVLTGPSSRIDLREDFQLKRISAPSWADQLRTMGES